MNMLRDHLTSWIKRRGYASQAEAAAALGISRPILNRVLSGKLPTVSRRNAAKIHAVAGIPLHVMGYAQLDVLQLASGATRAHESAERP